MLALFPSALTNQIQVYAVVYKNYYNNNYYYKVKQDLHSYNEMEIHLDLFISYIKLNYLIKSFFKCDPQMVDLFMLCKP
jgi:hypothetical protein